MDFKESSDSMRWLVEILQASLSENSSSRQAGEVALNHAGQKNGYGVCLTRIILDQTFPFGVRQLAGVVLKRYVQQHWQEGELSYTPPTVPMEDKAAIKSLIVQGLNDSDSKIQTVAGVAIAAIVAFDWPEEWPDLINQLLAAIRNHGMPQGVSGAVRCLALIADDIDDSQVPALVHSLFPALYVVCTNPQVYHASVRRRALHVFHSCVSTLGVMSGVYLTETRKLVEPILPAWMSFFAVVFTTPVPPEDPDDWGLRLEVYKCLMQIIQNFGKSVGALLPSVLGPLWQSYVSGIPVFERAAVRGEENAFFGLADEDGEERSLTTLAVQAFEFLLALISNPRFKSNVENSCEALVYFAIAYMQMTQEQMVLEPRQQFCCPVPSPIPSTRSVLAAAICSAPSYHTTAYS